MFFLIIVSKSTIIELSSYTFHGIPSFKLPWRVTKLVVNVIQTKKVKFFNHFFGTLTILSVRPLVAQKPNDASFKG
jgi:hypothetical protein